MTTPTLGTINLSKGSRINLAKDQPTLKKLRLGLEWKPRRTEGQDFDLDASALMLDENGKALGMENFIFYGSAPADSKVKTSPCGSVTYFGDSRKGDAEGFDEEFLVELDKIPANVHKIKFVVTIHEAQKHNQNFGMVDGAKATLLNEDTQVSVASVDLSEDVSALDSVEFVEVYRKDAGWSVKAVSEGFTGGLDKFLTAYGFQTTN